MKKSVLKCAIVLCVGSLLFSCGGGDDGEVAPIDTNTPTTWQFDDFKYNGGASSQVTTESEMGAFGVLVISTDEDESNGDYSGSALSITYAEAGEGNYRIVSQEDFITARDLDESAKVLVINCTVGIAKANATLYEAISGGGSAAVKIDGDNKYHIEALNLSLKKTIDVQNGVPNAPETGSLKITNAFDFSN